MSKPHSVALPVLIDELLIANEDPKEKSTPKSKRESKGSQALPIIRKLLEDEINWFTIESPNDYQYPGVFKHAYPKRVAYSEDVTTLSFYDESAEHFLFDDIQLGKGNTRGTRKISTVVGKKEEEVYYKIAPCKGIKKCGESGCSYIISTWENKQCSQYPQAKLESSGFCPVDFFYVWPANPQDKRRWVGGLVRSDDMKPQNIHNHPTNPPSKIPLKVQSDVRRAISANPHLKTSAIVIGIIFS